MHTAVIAFFAARHRKLIERYRDDPDLPVLAPEPCATNAPTAEADADDDDGTPSASAPQNRVTP